MYLHFASIIVNGFLLIVVENTNMFLQLQPYSLPAPPPLSSPLMLLDHAEISGRKAIAITMLPTMTARKTIMMGSSREVMAETALIHLFIIVVRNFPKHFRHSASLLACDIHHADDHRRKNAGSFQRGGDGLAFLDAFMDFDDGVADNDIAGGFLDDCQSLQNGNAAADERAERARKTRDGHLADDRSERGHLGELVDLSHTSRPIFVLLMISRNMITATISTPNVSKMWSLMISLIPSTNVVNHGSVMFMPAKTAS